jgi:sialidase-1
MLHRLIFALLTLTAITAGATAQEHEVTKLDLFTAGEGGYETYRIPGLIATPQGTLLAYCEARKSARGDWGQIDLLSRRSTDGGKTWGKPQPIGALPADVQKNEVATAQKLGEPDKFTMNNPVAITARDGTIHFLHCVEYARCFVMQSTDEGVTFSKPVEITDTFAEFRRDYAWKVLATGPAHGIELKSGRLIVPVWLSTGTGGHAHRPSAVSTIYSDDRGRTWRRGEIIVQHGKDVTNPSETIVVELADGRVMVNVRSESKEQRRLVSISADGATKWSHPRFDDELFEPVCMASIVRVDDKLLAYAHPNSQKRDRQNLTLRLSDDDGETWKWSRVLDPAFAAYSDLAVTRDGALYCLYESGGSHAKSYGALTLVKLSPDWIRQK